MSVEEQDRGGATFDDPNREAVGLEPAWVEGTGGSGEAPTPAAETTEAPPEPAPPEPEGEGEDEG